MDAENVSWELLEKGVSGTRACVKYTWKCPGTTDELTMKQKVEVRFGEGLLSESRKRSLQGTLPTLDSTKIPFYGSAVVRSGFLWDWGFYFCDDWGYPELLTHFPSTDYSCSISIPVTGVHCDNFLNNRGQVILNVKEFQNAYGPSNKK